MEDNLTQLGPKDTLLQRLLLAAPWPVVEKQDG